jgi:hypothetical protein
LESLLDVDTVEDTDTVGEGRDELEPTLVADVVLEAVEDFELLDDPVGLCVPRSEREEVVVDVCVGDSRVLRVLVGLVVVDLELLVVADTVLLCVDVLLELLEPVFVRELVVVRDTVDDDVPVLEVVLVRVEDVDEVGVREGLALSVDVFVL